MTKDFIIINFDKETLLDVAKPSLVYFLGTFRFPRVLKGPEPKMSRSLPLYSPIYLLNVHTQRTFPAWWRK